MKVRPRAPPGALCRNVERREKPADGGEHRVRPLADQQVAAVGDHAQGSPQPPGVLHPVGRAAPSCRTRPRGRGTGSRPGRDRAAGRSGRAQPRPRGCRCGGPCRRGTPRPSPGRSRPGRRRPTSRRRASGPRRERATRRRCGVTSRSGRSRPIQVTVRSPARVAEEIPAAAASTSPVTASGRRTAARRPTRPPSEWPTQGAGSASSCSSTASTASAKGSSVGAAGSAPEPPWPGSSGTITRRAAGEGGRDAPPVRGGAAEAVDEHERRPGAADEVAQRRSAVVQGARLEALRLVLVCREGQFGLRQHGGIFSR